MTSASSASLKSEGSMSSNGMVFRYSMPPPLGRDLTQKDVPLQPTKQRGLGFKFTQAQFSSHGTYRSVAVVCWASFPVEVQ